MSDSGSDPWDSSDGSDVREGERGVGRGSTGRAAVVSGSQAAAGAAAAGPSIDSVAADPAARDNSPPSPTVVSAAALAGGQDSRKGPAPAEIADTGVGRRRRRQLRRRRAPASDDEDEGEDDDEDEDEDDGGDNNEQARRRHGRKRARRRPPSRTSPTAGPPHASASSSAPPAQSTAAASTTSITTSSSNARRRLAPQTAQEALDLAIARLDGAGREPRQFSLHRFDCWRGSLAFGGPGSAPIAAAAFATEAQRMLRECRQYAAEAARSPSLRYELVPEPDGEPPFNSDYVPPRKAIDLNIADVPAHVNLESLVRRRRPMIACEREYNAYTEAPAALLKQPGAPVPLPEGELYMQVAISRARPQRAQRVQSCEFALLGSQTLADLRDTIPCVLDGAHQGQDVCKSACFFIENVFYNDMRQPGALDYSIELREWMEASSEHFEAVAANNSSPLATAEMAATPLRALTVRLNKPYLFLHQGDCEHVVIFTDVRLAHAADPQDTRNYPRKVFWPANANKQMCRVCRMRVATVQTKNDPFAPSDPCHFCEGCFVPLHYKPDGQKRGSFDARTFVVNEYL